VKLWLKVIGSVSVSVLQLPETKAPAPLMVHWRRRLPFGGRPRSTRRDRGADAGSELALHHRLAERRHGERYTGFRSGEMNDELQDLRNAGYKPIVVGPQPFSFEDLS